MKDIDRQWAHETTGAAGRQETHEHTRAGRQENLMKHQEQEDMTNRKKLTACMQEIWNINIIQQVCTQEKHEHINSLQTGYVWTTSNMLKGHVWQNKNTQAGEIWNTGTAGRHESYEQISSRQTWQIWKHQQHADMNKQENELLAHRNIWQHTQQPDRRNMKRADLTNRIINSKQTGQYGKQTAARQKKYEKQTAGRL